MEFLEKFILLIQKSRTTFFLKQHITDILTNISVIQGCNYVPHAVY